LETELGEVEIVSCLVAAVHALHQSALGPDAVEDYGIDQDGKNLDDDFDDGADKTPVLRCLLAFQGLCTRGGSSGFTWRRHSKA
jgi:hypothetical protein